ncbi:MAG: cation diffusion facilitator family transporter [Verrucomicrobiota bacterium]
MRQSTEGIRVTWIGLVLNLLLGVAKCFTGLWFGSTALVADGMHSLLDLLTDGAVLFGLYMSNKPEDESHLYGHHKFASFAKFGVGGCLLVFSILLVVSALMDFRAGRVEWIAAPAVLIAIVGLVLKETLFWWTRSVAKRLRSDLLLANALHHRMDSLSSLAVALALGAFWIGGPSWAFLDDAATLVLGSYLIFESYKVLRRGIDDLLDAAPAREIIEDFREHILPVAGVEAYHDLRTRRIGDFFEIDLHLQVDPALTVEHGHSIAREVKQALQAKHPEISKVLIHVEPATKSHIVERGISGAGGKSSGISE